MSDKFNLTDEHKEIIEAARRHLESHHGLNTSDLDDMDMAMRLVLITNIAACKEIEVRQALAEFGDKILDVGALVGEMVAAAEPGSG